MSKETEKAIQAGLEALGPEVSWTMDPIGPTYWEKDTVIEALKACAESMYKCIKEAEAFGFERAIIYIGSKVTEFMDEAGEVDLVDLNNRLVKFTAQEEE